MGIMNKAGRWVYVKRVPRRFQHLDPRSHVRVALGTDSRAEATRKAPAVEAEVFAYWEALAAGRTDDARRRYAAAKALAEARGFRYIPADDLAAGPLAAILERLEAAAAAHASGAAPEVVGALTGGVPRPAVTLTEAQAEFFEMTADRLAGKSPAQRHRWRLPRLRALANFVEVVGDKPVEAITRDDALDFRRWWQARVDGGLAANTANNCFGHLSDLVRT